MIKNNFKSIFVFVMVCFLAISSVALAKNDNYGQPFQELWNAIKNLQEQITNIQLVPGPQGLQGEKGEKGSAGEASWDEARIAALEARVSELEKKFIVCDSSEYTHSLILEDQNSFGEILSGNNIKGIFNYCLDSEKINYSFSGRAPIANIWYALVVGDDPLNHSENSLILSYIRSDGNNGDINIPDNSIELSSSLVNAKVWLVLGSDLALLPRYDGFTGWNAWHPEYYLFGITLIN